MRPSDFTNDSSARAGWVARRHDIVTNHPEDKTQEKQETMRALKKLKRGFTLVELMIVVAIVGVLAALAIYGVRKYVLNAKTAEARNSLGQMAKDASGAFNREGMDSQVLGLGSVAGVTNRLCSSGQNAVPQNTSEIKGQKYQSAPSEWSATSQEDGWACLKFSMQDPHYYQYDYIAENVTDANGTFQAIAVGDLDGDEELSTFRLLGKIAEEEGEGLVVTIAPNIEETDPEE